MGPCFRTQRGTDGALTCSKETETTPDGDQHCCDGLPTPPALTAASEGKKYVVLAPTDLLTRGCDAFSANCTGATAHAGTKALVLSVDEAARTCTAFVPRAQNTDEDQYDLPAAPPAATFTFPFFALFVNDTIDQKIVDLGLENPFNPANGGSYPTADGFNTVITQSDDARFPKGWFINMIKFNFVSEDRWIEWSVGARSKFRSSFNNGNRSVWISDQPLLPQGECRSLSFKDNNGDPCSTYAEKAWCTDHARPTAAGEAHWRSLNNENCPEGEGVCRMPGGSTDEEPPVLIANTNAAGFQCCQCGGGTHDEPTMPSAVFYQ